MTTLRLHIFFTRLSLLFIKLSIWFFGLLSFAFQVIGIAALVSIVFIAVSCLGLFSIYRLFLKMFVSSLENRGFENQ